MGIGNRLVAQSDEAGALPQLYAATAGGVAPGDYYGPRVLDMWGAPSPAGRAAPPATPRPPAACGTCRRS